MANFKKIIRDKKGVTGLTPTIKNTILVIFIFMCLASFTYGFLVLTNPSSDALSTSSHNSSLSGTIATLNKSMEQFAQFGNETRTILAGSEPKPLEYVFLIFKGAFTIPLAFLGTGITFISTIATSIFPGLSGASLTIVATAIGLMSSMLLVTLVFYILKAARTGETER